MPDGRLHKMLDTTGSIARYWIGSIITSKMGTSFPYGTALINITACVMIGFSLTFLANRASGACQ